MPKTMTALAILVSLQAFAQAPSYGTAYPNTLTADTCLKSICGDSKSAATFGAQDMNRARAIGTSIASDPKGLHFPESVEAKLKELQALDDAQNTQLRKKVAEGASADREPLKGVALAFYNISQASTLLASVKYVPEVKDGKPSVSIDEKTTREALKASSKSDQDWVIEIARSIVASISMNEVSDSDLESNSVTILLRRKHPGMSDADALKAEAQATKSNLDKIKSLSVLERAIYTGNLSEPSLVELQQKVAKGTATESEARALMKWNKSFAQSYATLGDPKSPVFKRSSPPLGEIVRAAGGDAAVSKVLTDQNAESRTKHLSQLQSCRVVYAMNEGLLPSDEQKAVTRRDVETSKTKIGDWIRRTYPASIQQPLLDSISKTDFAYAPSKAEFEREFEASIDRRLKSARDNAKSMANISAGGIRQLGAAVAATKKPAPAAPATPAYAPRERNEFCDSFEYPMLSDANYTTVGAVVLSRSTMTARPGVRETIINHELGHSLSKALRALANDATFERYRVCLNSTHPTNSALPADLNVEEDFADAVAESTTDPQMKLNPWCALLSQTFDQATYTEGGTESMIGDPHSSLTFRLLSFEFIRRGQLTPACNDLVSKSATPAKFRACLKESVAAAGTSSAPSAPAKAVK